MSIRRIHHIVAATGLALCVLAGDATAQGKGKGKSKTHGEAHGDVVRSAQPGTPPGLAKKGGLPPGQAKKYRVDDGVVVLRDVFGRRGYTVVRTAPYDDGRYVWYRTSDGLLHRAWVGPGTTRLTFRNVPQIVLSEVLARLY